MAVHLFSAASSPECANYTLKNKADDHEEELGAEAADTLQQNFYVDDSLKSAPMEESAVSLIKNVKGMCQKEDSILPTS